MQTLGKILLAPFALIYGLIIFIRNYLYDQNYFRAASFDLPVISVGNLSTGGTGKTPHVEYLINILKPYYPLGVLSRGYRRKTSGYLEVLATHSAIDVGDESLLTKWKHPDTTVAVAENRALGIPSLVSGKPPNFVVLLDDAFQHRGIKPGLNILLSTYHNLYTDDYLLPVGSLREFKGGAKRADLIIVTHTPFNISADEKQSILAKIAPKKYQHVFFSYISYLPMYQVFQSAIERVEPSKDSEIVLLTGIANNDKLLAHTETRFSKVYTRSFADHHTYTAQDIESIIATYKDLKSEEKYIVTTEKDLTRLVPFAANFNNAQIKVLCLPIKINFVAGDKERFDKAIYFYIHKTLEEYFKEEELPL